MLKLQTELLLLMASGQKHSAHPQTQLSSGENAAGVEKTAKIQNMQRCDAYRNDFTAEKKSRFVVVVVDASSLSEHALPAF